MTRRNFRRTTAAASSSPSTVPGIGRHMRKVATTSSFRRSPEIMHPAGAKYLPTVSREPGSRQRKRNTVPQAWQLDPMVRSTFPMTFAAGSTGSPIAAVREFNAANVTPCPSATAPAGNPVQEAAKPPEGTHPDAGRAASSTLPVPEGATKEMVVLGERIYRGEVGGAGCTGCHGETGQGTPLGPKVTEHEWLWSDGSYEGSRRPSSTVCRNQRNYRSPMPPMGGAQLTPDQTSALAAYVWGLSHSGASH